LFALASVMCRGMVDIHNKSLSDCRHKITSPASVAAPA
jgi:hypothetical protein